MQIFISRGREHQRYFLRFCLVGGSGFVVDSLLLMILMKAGMAVMDARIIAFWGAASCNWLCNRVFTYGQTLTGQTVLSLIRQWFSYMVLSGAGFLPNVGTFWLLIHFTPLSDWPLLAQALGISVGLIFNYLLTRRFIFMKN
ncbi:GtrA family protein [Salinisphaera sp. G21_0]|uniref:GtrA family protein n=1 Tax=Salinisphaera sp. G21_0 TaxID=2821094 RepID=UPI002570E963|nr:GtrA family protein [Salinisphaera sp. G21_0]